MIDCCAENLLKRKRKKIKLKVVAWLLVLISFLFYFHFFTANNIVNISKDYAYKYTTEALNEAVIQSLDNKVIYDDLIQVEKNSNGEIVLMRSNSYNVNTISRNISISANKILSQKLEKGIPIPLLAFTGFDFLSGIGKSIYLKIISISSVESDFISEFKSANINQTLHSIYVTFSAIVKIDFPLNHKDVITSSKILIAEAVLVGKVPDVYLNGKIFN